MFMRMTIVNNIKTSLPQTEFASEFLKSIEERFKLADKSLADTLMAELTTMKYDGQKGIQQHILNMTENDRTRPGYPSRVPRVVPPSGVSLYNP